MVLGSNGVFPVIEVESAVPDFRHDVKWTKYLPYSHRFYFGVSEHFPVKILLKDCGVIIADPLAAAIERNAPEK